MRARQSPHRSPFVLTLWAALCVAGTAGAQDNTEARLRDALRDTSAKLRTAEAQLAEQQLATAAAQRERDAVKQAPAPKADDARVAALQRQLGAASSAAAQLRGERDASQAGRQQSELALQKEETERAALATQLAQTRTQAARCAQASDAFYATGREIAALYRDPAFVDFARSHRRELLGFDRVAQENRVRALEDRLAEQQLQAQQCRTNAATPTAHAP